MHVLTHLHRSALNNHTISWYAHVPIFYGDRRGQDSLPESRFRAQDPGLVSHDFPGSQTLNPGSRMGADPGWEIVVGNRDPTF